jgi:hypothetical protein
MSYLSVNQYHNNSYLKNPITNFNPNRDKVGLNDNKIDSFLKQSIDENNDVEYQLMQRYDELEKYRQDLEQDSFIDTFINRLKSSKILEDHDVVQKLKGENEILKLNQKKQSGPVKGSIYFKKIPTNNPNDSISERIEELKKPQNYIETPIPVVETTKSKRRNNRKKKAIGTGIPKLFMEASKGSGVFSFIKDKLKKGAHKIKSIGTLLLIKHWKDLFNIMVKIARGEDISSDDVMFIKEMVQHGLINQANKGFEKFSEYFGSKVTEKLKDIAMSRNDGGMLPPTYYPSKSRELIKYPSKSIIF